jgi:hypothetical protein
MSEAPLAPQCRHCRATNDSGAAECWMCHRRDWRAPPGPPPPRPHRSGPEPLGLGCLFFIALGLIRVVYEAARFGWIAGIAAMVLAVLAFAVAIAMFVICTTVFKVLP